MQNHKNTNSKKRKNLTNIILFIFFIIIVRYFYIQVITKAQFIKSASKNNFTKIESIPPRGIIYDRNGEVIVANKRSFSIKIYPNNYDEIFDIDLFYKIINSAEKRSKILIEKDNFLKIMERNQRSSVRRYKPISIINFIDFKTKALLSEYKNSFPGLLFSSNPSRFYEESPRISHVLGYLRPVPKDSVDNQGYYGINDIIGISGIEKVYEKELRGKKGVEYHVVNTFGKDLGIDKNKSIPYISGKDIYLTIDYNLQSFIENLIKDYKGAVICMNPINGEILAMVSAPDYSLSQFIGPLKQDIWEKWKKENRLVNRATQGRYAPGSLYKLVTSIMFMDQQFIPLDQKVFCDGKFELEDQSNPGKPKIFRCWNESGHGEVDLHDAIVQSCNVYFYDMILKYQENNKYIINDLHKYAKILGFDQKTGLQIPEKEGRIPDSKWMVVNEGRDWPKRGSMPNLSIGQGSNSITPIQAINLINYIAMRGEVHEPKLVLGSSSNVIKSNISKYVWDEIQEAMYDVVNTDKGTASMLKNNNAIIRGKTGTAQTISSSRSDHLLSWFGGYMESDNGLFSLVVLIEDTDSQTKSIAKVISKKVFDYILENKENE